ncbi:MAG: hypothetical protein ACREN4_02290 [Candidatus Dormibacteria bacterium]
MRFDNTVGHYCGQPIQGTVTFSDHVHVIGSGGRAFSQMSPAEVDRYIEDRR